MGATVRLFQILLKHTYNLKGITSKWIQLEMSLERGRAKAGLPQQGLGFVGPLLMQERFQVRVQVTEGVSLSQLGTG